MSLQYGTLVLLLIFPPSSGQSKVLSNAACNTTACILPECLCPSDKIPDNLEIDKIPQVILFSFNGPVTAEHGDTIKRIFNRRRRNPNGTPIRSTLFVSDDQKETDYCTVNGLWAEGHEVASFSVNRRDPASWWATASKEDWEQEIDSQKLYISGNASVPLTQIIGFRSPHLQTGGNAQYEFAVEREYVYDSSIVLPILAPRIWPYTMDYPTNFPCYTNPCPDGSFPGLWQIPIQPLVDRTGQACIYLDSCMNSPRSADEVFNVLSRNFRANYITNRAPLMINFNNYKDWFENNEWAQEGVERFLDEILAMGNDDDVWIISYRDLLGWMQTPTELRNIRYFAPFDRIKEEKDECEEKRNQSAIDGRWLLVSEVLLCVGAFIYLYAKEHAD